MYESDVEDVHTCVPAPVGDCCCDCDQQAVDISIVILVDGEEKCNTTTRACTPQSSASTHRSIACGDQSSRPTTPKSNPSCTSLQSGNRSIGVGDQIVRSVGCQSLRPTTPKCKSNPSSTSLQSGIRSIGVGDQICRPIGVGDQIVRSIGVGDQICRPIGVGDQIVRSIGVGDQICQPIGVGDQIVRSIGVGDQICQPIGDQICRPIGDQTCRPIGDQICQPIGDQTCRPIGDQICRPIGNQIVPTIGVGDQICRPVGDQIVPSIGVGDQIVPSIGVGDQIVPSIGVRDQIVPSIGVGDQSLRPTTPKLNPSSTSLQKEHVKTKTKPTIVSQLNFVDYFLKSEGGVASVLTLAEIKLEYEKKCKTLLANMSGSKRTQAEEFFNRIIEAIQVKVPESNYTEIKHYNLMKYLQPIVSALHLNAHDEVHHINKYHGHVLSEVNLMEERLREKQVVDPDAMVDIETKLLAGIMSRFYPLFIKLKETATKMAAQRDSSHTVSSDEFIKQLRKLILAIYVEIVCIDVTFNNTLTSLNYLPSVDVQEKYRQQMAIRKKHARHAVTWAARCITTALLDYHIETEIMT